MFEKSFPKISKVKILVVLIILGGIILRFWNFEELFYFAIDEEKGAYIIQGIASGSHFPSVGHPSSIGFRLGPLFYYIAAPLFKYLSPTPLTIGYVSVVMSVFSMLLIYRLGLRINRVTAFIALTMYSFSFLNVIYERRGWQLSFESFFILIIIHSLLELKKGKDWFLFPIIISITILTQLEVGLFTLIPLILLSFYIFRIRIVNKKYLFASIVIIFLANIGLLFFDLRHNFINSQYLMNYFKKDTAIRVQENLPLKGIRNVYMAHEIIPNTLSRTLYPSSGSNLAVQYANCPQYLNFKYNNIPDLLKLIVTFIILLTIIMFFRKKENNDKGSILKICGFYFIIHFSAIAVYTYLFHGELAEYYLVPTFVFFFIACSYFISRIWNKKTHYLLSLIMLLFIVSNSIILLRSDNPYGYKNKLHAVQYAISSVSGKPFILDSFLTCWYTGGYRYLFTFKGHEPVVSYMDNYLTEYYQPNHNINPVYKVTILTPELIGNNPVHFDEFRRNLQNSSSQQKKFGAIEVYIEKLL